MIIIAILSAFLGDNRPNGCYRCGMCNLYSSLTTHEATRRLFRVSPDRDRTGNQPPLSAIFPRYDAPVVCVGEDGAREVRMMHWGFLMPQVSRKTGKPILPKAVNNARDDKVRSSPFWRQSFQERRCLVPATSFCEAKGRNPATYYWFGLVGDESRQPFAFAGLWRRFRGNYRGELVEIETYTIVTTTPNELVREVHPDRMPVIMPPDRYEAWLRSDPDDAFELIEPLPSEAMRIVQSGEGLKQDDGETPG